MKAEAVGFDSLWLYDHPLYRAPNQPTEGIWEAWTILSALAEATTRVDPVHMNSTTAGWAIDRSAIVRATYGAWPGRASHGRPCATCSVAW